ncbi:MAG: RTA1 domain-containing protein [Terriglobus roseus]|nr:RTA1 domain-containing protein [Terriglobus roseus]
MRITHIAFTAQGSVWYYAPNKVAPIVFAALFFVSGLVHLWQNSRYKAWKITPLLPWAALLMTAGFATREVGAHNYDDVGIYIASTVLIMTGPPVYAAVNYIVFSRLLYYVPYLSPVHPMRVLVTFLGVDVIIEVLIANGVARVANTGNSLHSRQVGEDLLRSALILQAVFFVIFALIGVRFQWACHKKGVLNRNLKTVLYVMYASCALITTRCVYRIVEYFQGFDGTIYDTEWYFWVFEATIMFLNTLLLNVFHPGRFLPASSKSFLGVDGAEREGPGWEDKRAFLFRLLDPLDIYGLLISRDKHAKFWEWTPEELEAYIAKQNQDKADRDASGCFPWSSRRRSPAAAAGGSKASSV